MQGHGIHSPSPLLGVRPVIRLISAGPYASFSFHPSPCLLSRLGLWSPRARVSRLPLLRSFSSARRLGALISCSAAPSSSHSYPACRSRSSALSSRASCPCSRRYLRPSPRRRAPNSRARRFRPCATAASPLAAPTSASPPPPALARPGSLSPVSPPRRPRSQRLRAIIRIHAGSCAMCTHMTPPCPDSSACLHLTFTFLAAHRPRTSSTALGTRCRGRHRWLSHVCDGSGSVRSAGNDRCRRDRRTSSVPAAGR